MKRKILIGIAVCLLGLYIFYCVSTLATQPNTAYLNKWEVKEVFENNKDYFQEAADYFENRDVAHIYYDSSQQEITGTSAYDPEEEKWVENKADPDDVRVVEKMCRELSFNMIQRDDSWLDVFYVRPFDHSITIGISYNYDTKKWTTNYSHNYDRCTCGHHGYRVYDLIFNW